MDFSIEVRENQLRSLNQYITSSKDKVQSILDYLGWNAKKCLEVPAKTTCMHNRTHQVHSHKSDQHANKCHIECKGYTMDDKFLSEPSCSSSSPSSIKIDISTKVKIFTEARSSNHRFKSAWNSHDPDPMTTDRYFSTFSNDERSALYDYCVQNTKGPSPPPEFNININEKKEEKSLTEEEMLVKERDAKRRRVKYKSVHTGRNKSHTEIMKQVIDNQMELYQEYVERKISSTIYSEPGQSDFPSPTNIKFDENVVKGVYEDFSLCYPIGQYTSASNQEIFSNIPADSKTTEQSYDYQKYDQNYESTSNQEIFSNIPVILKATDQAYEYQNYDQNYKSASNQDIFPSNIPADSKTTQQSYEYQKYDQNYEFASNKEAFSKIPADSKNREASYDYQKYDKKYEYQKHNHYTNSDNTKYHKKHSYSDNYNSYRENRKSNNDYKDYKRYTRDTRDRKHKSGRRR